MTFWVALFLSALALYLGMPLLCIFFKVVGAWEDHLYDRLSLAADRFCEKRGWYRLEGNEK